METINQWISPEDARHLERLAEAERANEYLYRVLDIGNLDLEYEWYVRQAAEKMPLEKHEIVGEAANREKAAQDKAYAHYLEQVKCWL